MNFIFVVLRQTIIKSNIDLNLVYAFAQRNRPMGGLSLRHFICFHSEVVGARCTSPLSRLMRGVTERLGPGMNANAQIYLHAALSPSVPPAGAGRPVARHSRMHMGRPVMEDAGAALSCTGEMIMHHTYFWEEFIDEGGRNGVGGS